MKILGHKTFRIVYLLKLNYCRIVFTVYTYLITDEELLHQLYKECTLEWVIPGLLEAKSLALRGSMACRKMSFFELNE